MTLEGHKIKGLCEFKEGSSSLYISTLPSLVNINRTYFRKIKRPGLDASIKKALFEKAFLNLNQRCLK